MRDSIYIKGAREHNLKNIDIEIPRNKFVVLTGLSGSGKSSLAFDTLYAEGQRRYVESLSSYARQFLGQMEKPDVDYIEGLSPAISIDQKTTSRNPRSTVGTVTEIHDYLRLLYARIGVPHCPDCGKPIHMQTIDQMVDAVMALPEGTRVQVLAPVVRGRKGEFHKLLEDMSKAGFVRARVDGEAVELSDTITLNKQKKHTIEIVVDRLVVREGIGSRLADSLETALGLAAGLVLIDTGGKKPMMFSQNYACPDCGINMEELAPRMFSFNSPFGACPECMGLGTLMRVDPDMIVPDKRLSLNEGAVSASGWSMSGSETVARMSFTALANHCGFSLDTPFEELDEKARKAILYGTGSEKIKFEYERGYGSGTFMNAFEGVITNLERRYRETQSEGSKQAIEGYMTTTNCPVCGGERLKKEARSVFVSGMSLPKVSALSISEARKFFSDAEFSHMEMLIASQILKEIDSRLGFLADVGLGYLTLARAAATLSGGEAQRIRLATQIGASLMGVLYILDEPSIGLHQRDNSKLLKTLKNLRDLGNTLVVVEHDEETMMEADYLIDIGPGAGAHGGLVVAQGTVSEVMENEDSLTGLYLSGKRAIEIPAERRKPNGRWLTVRGASENNLKEVDAAFPIGLMTCVTGVSGSGKSSLVNHVLQKALAHDLNRAKARPGKHKKIDGMNHLDKVIGIDQSPIGRTPRSNPATYTGVFDLIRDIFSATSEAKLRGYKANRFSFNVKGGRCEACSGDGIIKIEMHFLPDIYVPCEVCKGKRYNRETLEVHYKGKNISEVLEMTVEEALDFFSALPRLRDKLQTLYDVGLGYIKLGQPSTTLSGGEAQRIKLATELSRASTGKTMYILDEPTTGLHVADVEKLVGILSRLTEVGNTVVVIEHNLDVIKTADYVIDMGPEGGDKGGYIIASGTPEEVCAAEGSHTGEYLKKALKIS